MSKQKKAFNKVTTCFHEFWIYESVIFVTEIFLNFFGSRQIFKLRLKNTNNAIITDYFTIKAF